MMELPEAAVIVKQLNETISGKKIRNVTAAQSPHKFAWFYGDPQSYHQMLTGKTIGQATGYGGLVEIKTDAPTLLLGDGVGLRYHAPKENRPSKHQLLIEFEDLSAISATVQMYGGIWCFYDAKLDNVYYKVAKEKPSPLTGRFNEEYFQALISGPDFQKLSAKAFLATEQRIPGLGNGVLQDILWNAKIHPKRKISALTEEEKKSIFESVKTLLSSMTKLGGRDTEKDLFGNSGGYKTVMSKNNTSLPCPVCSDLIRKENYLGGSIYYCADCQKL